jgi:hypothetical protein
MDLHDILKLTGGLLALALFVPMIVGVVRDGGAGQSFATWILWAVLDTILSTSIILQHGNYFIVLGFAIGGWLMAGLLLWRRRVTWGRFESGVLVLVIACVAAWRFSGALGATMASTLVICVAGIPGLVALWRNPNRKLSRIWTWYVVANGLAFCGGTDWSVAERFAPGAFAVFAVLMLLAARRKARS